MRPSANTTRAVLFMLGGMLFIPTIDVFAKILGQQGFHVVQMVWARFFFGAIAVLPFVLVKSGAAGFQPNQPYFQIARAASLIAGTALFFSALNFLPVADTLALFFVQPILVTALSPIFLGEQVSARRWLLVLLGFVGVLIIIRPGFQAFNAGVLLSLGAGLCSSFYFIITRHMSSGIDAITTNFHTCLVGAIPLSAALPFFWVDANATQWAMMVGIGVIAAFCHYLIAKAYGYGEASLVSPIAFTEMINAVSFGWLFFGDFPDRYTFLGVGVLIACAIAVSVTGRGTRTTTDNANGKS